mgnify:FL=1
MIDEGRVLAARDVLAHRGPDDAGLYLSCTNASIHPNVALAHRRLSIIDLSPAAHQPMLCERREQGAERIAKSAEHRPFDYAQGDAAPRYVIVFNGEIYNYKSLLPSPPPKGEGAFKSNSDTEVILNLYAQYGKDCLQYLRGMFAFAIWDEQEKTLFAARDRFGIKPFYYLHDANPPDGEAGLSTGKVEFIFSSELKAIKHYKGNLTINNDALDAFLRTGSVPAPLTIYNEVAALLPGYWLEWKMSEVKCQKYWEFREMMVNGKWLMDDGKKVLDSRLYADKAGLHGNEGINEAQSVGSPQQADQLANEESKTMDSRLSADKAGLRGNDRQEERSGHTASLDSARDDRLSMTEMDTRMSADKAGLRGNEGINEAQSVGSPPQADQLANEESKTMDSRMSADKAGFRENDRIDGTQSLRGEQLQSNLYSKVDSRLSDDKAGLRENDRHKGINEQDKNTNRHTDPSNHASMHPYFHALRYDDNAKQKIRTALLDTIKAHLVADVEVGAFLSGGIDSTAIVSLMRQCGQEKIKTVSVIFPGNKLDESKYARLAAKTYNTEHIEIPFYEKDLLDDFENIMAVMDQPTIDGINTYFVSKAAKQAGLKVVLSGLGGDELFSGYPSFNLIPKYQRIKNLPFAKMFMKFAAPLLKNKLPAKAIHYMKNPNEPNAEYKLVRGLFTDSELQTIGWKSNSHQSSVLSPQTMNDTVTKNDKSYFDYAQYDTGTNFKGLSDLQRVSYLESCYYMRNQLLRDSDVFSMAHSIELRVPFVDHLLYEAVLPYLDDAYDKNFPKKMLVEAVGDIPDEIVHRPKMGFTFPFEDWFRNGQLKDLMNVPKASLWEKNKNLNPSLNINHLPLTINHLHWSRLWALYILSQYV